jgi:hypothetical protein
VCVVNEEGELCGITRLACVLRRYGWNSECIGLKGRKNNCTGIKCETCGSGLRSVFFLVAGRSLVCKREVRVPNMLQVLCIRGESRIVGEYSPVQFVSRGAYSCLIFEVYSAANASIES